MKHKKNNDGKKVLSLDEIVDRQRLKADGVTRDPNEETIDPLPGDDVSGGKIEQQNTTGVCGHWPTTSV